MSSLVRTTNVEHTIRKREFCNNKSNKRQRTEAVGMISPSKQKCSTNVQEDIEKIIHFLKSIKGPQKTITIARACGYETAKYINPSLYQMEKQKLVQKANDKPPLWCLLHTASDISGNVTSSPRHQFDPDNTCQVKRYQIPELKSDSGYLKRGGGNSKDNQIWSRSGMSRFLQKRKYGKSTENPNKNTGGIKSNYSPGNTCLKAGALLYEASISNATVQTNQLINRGSLFKKTINDKNAPGAYKVQEQLEHSNEKRNETFDFYRRHSPNYPNRMTSELPKVLHEYKESHDIVSSIEGGGGKYFTERAISSLELQDGSPSAEVNVPEFFNNADVPIMEDDSEYTDDEDYDLNFRISEVVSIRDPDVRADLRVLKNCEVKSSMQNCTDSDTSYDIDKNMVTFNMPESSHEPEKRYISEHKQSRKYDQSVMHQFSGPPPYPDQLLQNISSFKYGHDSFQSERQRSIMEHSDISNTPQASGRNNYYSAGQNNNSNDSIMGHVNSAQGIGLNDKELMPWLSSNSKKLHKEQVTYSTELTNIIGPSLSILAETSLLPMPQITSLPIHGTSSSFEQHLLQDTKASIPVLEYPNFVDCFKQSKRMSLLPYTPFLSQQEYFQQKRPPLLSTPDTREFSNFLRCSSGSGKLALLPCPGQSTHQLQQQVQLQQQSLQQETPTNLQISTESFAALNKNPISAFMEYGQCRHTPARIEVLSQCGPSHKPVFTIAAVLGSRIFPGITSSNKKDGKKDAAEQAIRILIAEGQYNMPASSSVMSIPESSMTQFDKIAALTHHKFNQLIAVIPESLVGRKVIAGLVMKMNDADTGTVVAIGSGNRCITGDKLSLRGLTLNDCHAEIITRRGFIRFLYYQLRSYDSNKFHPLFEKSTTGKLRIKRSITFHLYISTAPCGDGALFSPRDVESNNVILTDSCSSHRPTFDTNVQGVLRTKMEGGEGTIPVDPEKLVQTWDGIVRGERLRTMSCSDKICRWNVVGLQGALLANFMDPVYLNSITLGFLFDAGHLSRAVCCRLDRGEPSLDNDLPFPYHLNHPVLGRVTACDATRETQKTKSYSINWMVKDEKPEIVDGCQGTCYTGDKNESSQASRLCKKYLFDYFNQTCQILGHQEAFSAPTYSMAKRLSTKFHQAKEAMITKFKDTNCGIWLGKPSEEEMFS